MAIILKDIVYENVINKIDIEIKFGNIVSIVGPNGCGKTKLLDILCGKEKNFRGNVIFEKEQKISYVLQDIKKTFFCDTLEKEMELFLEENNYPKEKIKKRIIDSFRLIGLPSYFLQRDPLTLSSSEIRLAALARAISVNPDLIIIDEPIIGMSDYEKNNLIQILKKVKRRYKKTIVLVSQDMDFIYKVSDSIYVIVNGKVLVGGEKSMLSKNADELFKNDIFLPHITNFERYAKYKKKFKPSFRDDINDLIKDILRNIK